MFKDMTIDRFTEILASEESLPGGGSASALAGASAVSLVSMVASLTVGKKGYEESWSEMKRIIDEMEEYRIFFLDAMDKDAGSYSKVIDCFKMPKGTEEEKECRLDAIQNALYLAAVIPLEIALKASEIFSYAETVILKGNKNAVSDGAVAALMARAAIKGALHNVLINALSIKDTKIKDELIEKSQLIDSKVDELEKGIVAMVNCLDA